MFGVVEVNVAEMRSQSERGAPRVIRRAGFASRVTEAGSAGEKLALYQQRGAVESAGIVGR